ncbi:MAG: hypothetical protein VX385_03000, partial [Acidobacteriota bacterium]|nr:hypothetical protein [Acidobacteriota bacterium]
MTNDAGISFSHEFGGGVGDFVSESGGSGGAWLDYDVDGRLDVFLVNGLPTWGDYSKGSGHTFMRSLGDLFSKAPEAAGL